MPLSISIDSNNTGSPATYWVITAVMIDFVRGVADVSLNGYTDSTSHANGDNPLIVTTLEATSAGSSPTAALLAGAKTNLQNDLLNYPMFSGATIVS